MMKNFSTAHQVAQADVRTSPHTGATADEIRDWLRLTLTHDVSPAVVRRLLKSFGGPANVFAQPIEALSEVLPIDVARRLLGPLSADIAAMVDATIAWASQPDRTVLTLADAAYPAALLMLTDPPPVLHCLGDPARLAGNAVTLVGSRQPTPQGLRHAAHFAQALGNAGLTVASGLARGIDAAAHEGAIATASGTLAVVGTGLDIVYPAQHKALAERIAQSGSVIISEFPLGTPPRPDHFPRRNRLLAALGRVTLVIEATERSGSLITARLAAELGRDVLALPGSIHAPQSAGCHALIREGATLATTPEDVLEAIRWPQMTMPTRTVPNRTAPKRKTQRASTTTPVIHDTATASDTHRRSDHTKGIIPTQPHRALPSSPLADALLDALGYDPVNIDTLCALTNLSAAAIQQQLFTLELAGHVARLPGARYQRIV